MRILLLILLVAHQFAVFEKVRLWHFFDENCYAVGSGTRRFDNSLCYFFTERALLIIGAAFKHFYGYVWHLTSSLAENSGIVHIITETEGDLHGKRTKLETKVRFYHHKK